MDVWRVSVRNRDGSTAWTMALAEYHGRSKGLALEPGQSLVFEFEDDKGEWVAIPVQQLPVSVEWSET